MKALLTVFCLLSIVSTGFADNSALVTCTEDLRAVDGILTTVSVSLPASASAFTVEIKQEGMNLRGDTFNRTDSISDMNCIISANADLSLQAVHCTRNESSGDNMKTTLVVKGNKDADNYTVLGRTSDMHSDKIRVQGSRFNCTLNKAALAR